MIVVTHDPEVAALGDRQIVLNHGRIVRQIDNRANARVPVALTPPGGRS